MKKRKFLFLTSILSVSSIAPFFLTMSCSNSNQTSNYTDLEPLKNVLDKIIIDNKLNITNKNNINVSSSLDTKSINLFNILNSSNVDLSVVFSFNTKQLVFNEEKYKIFVEFTYNTQDSFGNFLNPRLTSNKKEIIVPALIWLQDIETNTMVCKYVDMFTLSIEESIIDDETIEAYFGFEAKKVTFNSNSKKYDFKSVPSIMVDKFLDFIILITTSNEWKKGPIYKLEDLDNWKDLTLSQVMSKPDNIKPPTNYVWSENPTYTYNYSIFSSTFFSEDTRYATFVMDFSLSSKNLSNIISDAEKLYGMYFKTQYTWVSNEWEFAKPSKSDIEKHVTENKNTLDKFLSDNVNKNILLYTPTFVWNNIIVKEWSVEKIIQAFERGTKIFEPPSPTIYKLDNGQVKNISFSIKSLNNSSSNSDVIGIDIEATINEGSFSSSSTYSKYFNKISLEFVES